MRYEMMFRAIVTNDKAAVVELLAPTYRSSADLERLKVFVVPLDGRSSLSFANSDLVHVFPRRQYHFGVIPGGDSIDMVRIDGEWYFTGKVNID